jgi:cathepsin A (carboxypeptidase C)
MRTVCLVLAIAAAVCTASLSLEGSRYKLNEANGDLCDNTVQQWSGYLDVNDKSKMYFYWAFSSRNDPANDPVVLWMTGGPGCSSMLALLTENGPCSVNKEVQTQNNIYSWTANATVIWIDQPAGTGFSYGSFPDDYDHDETGVARDMFAFLQLWFKNHENLLDNEFYVFGESYGGHYVPATSARVFEGQQKGETKINFKGLGIGNGLTDPEIQYTMYPEMAYNNTYGPIVTEAVYEQMVQAVPACIEKIKACQADTDDCASAQRSCNNKLLSPALAGGVNQYDVRIKCAVPPLCYDFSAVTKFYAEDSVKTALGVPTSRSWVQCSNIVNVMFSKDWMKNYQQLLPPMLEAGKKVLIYAGDADFVCNYMGNKKWTLALPWTGKDAFNAAEDMPWSVDGVQKGLLRSANNFHFLQVFKAGHMVPMDQPRASQDMLNRFVQNKL